MLEPGGERERILFHARISPRHFHPEVFTTLTILPIVYVLSILGLSYQAKGASTPRGQGAGRPERRRPPGGRAPAYLPKKSLIYK